MAVPYATTADFANCFDVRALNELCSDSDADGSYSGNSLLEEILTQASYDVQSYVLRGSVYTAEELDQIQTSGDRLLVRLTCVLAAEMLLVRRMGTVPDGIRRELDRAYGTLADLRDGKRVFGDLSASKAGAVNPTVSFVSASQRPGLKMAADAEFFPYRITEAT